MADGSSMFAGYEPEAYPPPASLAALVNFESLDEAGQQRVARAALPDLVRDIAVAQERLRLKEVDLADLKRRRDALNAIEQWSASGPFRLEQNDCSRVHRLAEVCAAGQLVIIEETKHLTSEHLQTMLAVGHVFVVRHDWSAALGDAAPAEGGDFNLPFERCIFEFRVSGHNIIIVATQAEGCSEHAAHLFVECAGQWVALGASAQSFGPTHLVWHQVFAICVALEAEVATSSVTRAPEALNRKRERKGAPLLRDFHVIDLARRRRVAPGASGGSQQSRKRLHFRRGHWRHFEASKTWIKWCLVGDPELGFVDKEYRL